MYLRQLVIFKTNPQEIINLKEDEIIKQVSLDNPEASSEQISQIIKSMGISISSSTIRRRLKSLGMQYCHPLSKPLLLKRHRIARLKFAKENKNTDWSKVFFTDEPTFQLFPNPRRLWMNRSKKLVHRVVKHPSKIHEWEGF